MQLANEVLCHITPWPQDYNRCIFLYNSGIVTFTPDLVTYDLKCFYHLSNHLRAI